MGACGSKPRGCVGVSSKLNLKKKRKKKQKTRTLKNANSLSNKHNNRVEPSDQVDVSYNNPAFQDLWFDPVASIDSDCDDEFYSVQDDVSQAGSMSAAVTPKFAMHCNGTMDFQLYSDEPQNEVKDSSVLEKYYHQCAADPVEDETGFSHSCGFLSNALLPCVACDDSSDSTRKSFSTRLSTARKKILTSSFKWREGQENPVLLSAKPVLQRPIAGSQIMCSPLDKKTAESWSKVEPNAFKVRGQNYNRDKRKEFAPNYVAYVPFGADVFLSPHKVNHIARFVELPSIDSTGELPPILVVNLQIPLYTATIFQKEYDGEGMSFVFYFKLSENDSQNLPVHFRENIKRMIDNETEKIKGFPVDTNLPFRERLKILGRVVNFEDLQLSAAERKLMHTYNEKPVLSRPQHEFYLGENYFEIDLDIHKFSYIARKGLETFQDRIKHCVFDFGLTIQGNKAEDLPECMLCCIRLKEIDYTHLAL
ncbi:UNVERIFIED_CONTAM: hypothetical protein Sradi_0967000 [Sesamum radiatum]|uniref:Protein ENHANCED DISEASE RESISTANCE 2 C-terminal domain-containing protein n=1 Tax=Sesamum radiatum TaxID=300843 RepID=A0AAW2V781_SESRA